MVKPCERACDLLYLCDRHLIRDGIHSGFELGAIDGISKQLVTVFGSDILYEDGIGSSRWIERDACVCCSVIIALVVLKDVDAIVLHVREIDGIGTDVVNELSDDLSLGGAAD